MINKNNYFFNSSILKKIFAFLLCFFVFFTFFTPKVYADDAANPEKATYDYNGETLSEDEIPNSIAKTCFKWAINVFDLQMLTAVQNILTIDIETYATADDANHFASVWDIVESIYNSTYIVGILFCLLYFLMGLLDKAQTENFNLEQFFKSLLKLFTTILLLKNGLTLMEGAITFGNQMITYVTTTPVSGSAGNLIKSYYDYLKTVPTTFRGNMSALAILLDLMVPYLGIFIARIIVYVIVYSRMFELFLRAAFLPIGIAEMFNGSGNASGMRYLKKLFATALQGAVILAILLIYGGIITSVFGGLGGSLGILIVTFAVITLLMKSQTWATDILGV